MADPIGFNPTRSIGDVAGVGQEPDAASATSFEDAFARLLPKAGGSLLLGIASDIILELQATGDENSASGGPAD